MLKRLSLLLVGVLFLTCTTAAHAYIGTTYGWENGGTILGSYNDIDAFNVGDPDPVHSGEKGR